MSELGKEKRELNFRHGACLGHVAMALKNMDRIVASPTTTIESKALARKVQALLCELRASLAERAE